VGSPGPDSGDEHRPDQVFDEIRADYRSWWLDAADLDRSNTPNGRPAFLFVLLSCGRDVMRHHSRRLGYSLVAVALALVVSVPASVCASAAPPDRPQHPPRPWVTLCLKLKLMPQHRRIRCHFPPAPRLASSARLAAENRQVPAISELSIPTNQASPIGITSGPDGALWCTENYGNKIGRLATTGTFIEYSLPTSGSEPGHITVGPDGALWFTEAVGNKIGRITTSGTITEYSLPT
jgi:virginiamycin B lyase